MYIVKANPRKRGHYRNKQQQKRYGKITLMKVNSNPSQSAA